MNKDIKQILNDLYMIDPELKNHEKDLVKIINNLLESRPNTKFDEKFVKKLKQELMAEVNSQTQSTSSNAWQVFNFNFMKKPVFAGVGIIVIVIAIMAGSYYMTKKNIGSVYDTIKIAQLENNAFGSLQSDQPQELGIDMLGKGIGAGNGGGGLALSEASASVGMIAPEWINYSYVYKGEDLEIAATEMEVLKRTKDKASGQEFTKYISKINLGSVDLGKFQNTEITNLQINENREFGYSLYLDFRNNNMSINTNWEKWPNISTKCQGLEREASQKCYDENRLKIGDVPADETIIAIADKFLKDYEIDMSMYGTPEVLDYWRNNYDLAEDKTLAYIPESMLVIYPLIINDQIIYDESGNTTGLNVEVNIRNNKAGGLSGLTSQNYVSSNYAIENDSQEIIKIAENGGLRRMFNYPEASKTVEVELGTPTLGLIKYYQPNIDKGETAELLVPAYIFPIMNAPEGGTYTYTKNIVVPLVKEIIAERISGDDNSINPRPMPLIEPARKPMIEETEKPKAE